MCCSKLKTFKNNGLTALQTLGGRSIIICIFLARFGASGVGAGGAGGCKCLSKVLIVENPNKIRENSGKIPETSSTDVSTLSNETEL